MKWQSKRSNKSSGYKLWHLLSIKSIHHIAKANNATWLTAKHINASWWYKLQLTLQYFTIKSLYFIFLSFLFLSFLFLQWHYIKIHCQLLLIFIRNKKIQASALIISQTDHKLLLVIQLWRKHWYLLRPLFSHWVAVEHFASSSTTCTVNQAQKAPRVQVHNTPFKQFYL